jgi:murein DD-endopeptidase MepM/ murein hydrolase activator NlpD
MNDCRAVTGSATARAILGVWLGLLLSVSALRAADELVLEGEFVQGGLVRGTTRSGARVEKDGEPVPVSEEGVFLLGFDRDAPAVSRLSVSFPGGGTIERRLSVQGRDYRIQRIDGLPAKKVTPDPAVLGRIREEAARVRKARERIDPRTDFLDGFVWPASGRISGVYGSQRVLNGQPRRPHYGVDVAAPTGTPVHAPAGGIVTLAEPDLYYSGGTVILDHGHGLSSSFLHLSRVQVKEGQVLSRGDRIGEIGATGRATGPHLDWRMNLRRAYIDPELLVSPMAEAP